MKVINCFRFWRLQMYIFRFRQPKRVNKLLNFAMLKLNLPEYAFRTKMEEGKHFIFDSIRKKFVALTPEEWVRQNFIQYLIKEKKYPESLMAVEKQIMVNKKQQRFDLLVYLRNGQPHLIAEFKAPNVKITQDAFDLRLFAIIWLLK